MSEKAARPTPFDDLLARTGVKLPDADIAELRTLVKAMDEAASIVAEPLPPATPPAVALRLDPSRP